MVGGSMRVWVGRAKPVGLAAMVVALCAGCFSFKPFDFTGAKRAEAVTFDSTSGTWTRYPVDGYDPHGSPTTVLATDAPSAGGQPFAVPGDYDGNGRYEPAVVYRNVSSSSTVWQSAWVTHGGAGTIVFDPPAPVPGTPTGQPYFTSFPVPGAYDGGKTLPAWYREYDATWFIMGHAPIQFGSGPTTSTAPSGSGHDLNLTMDQDVPVPADYDGDGKTDLAVFRPTTGVWRIRSSRDGTVSTLTLGGPNTFPAPADYDGVKHAQPAVMSFYGLAPGRWTVAGHAPVDVHAQGNVLVPAPADYTGDGKAELSYVADTQWNLQLPSPWSQVVPVDLSTSTVVPAELPVGLYSNVARLTLIGRNECGFNPPYTC